MDPMSAIAIAGTAFNAIKAGFEHGREIEAMAGDMGRWMGAIKDDKDKSNKKKKKMYGSIEEEAFEEFAALKEAERGNFEVYHEVTESGLARLCCLGVEVFGQWSNDPLQTIPSLVRDRARGLPSRIRRGMELAVDYYRCATYGFIYGVARRATSLR